MKWIANYLTADWSAATFGVSSLTPELWEDVESLFESVLLNL